MKKLIGVLMMVSLPAMAITGDAARTLLKSHGIDPTVIADLSGGSWNTTVTALTDGTGILNVGTTGTFSYWDGETQVAESLTGDAAMFTNSSGQVAIGDIYGDLSTMFRLTGNIGGSTYGSNNYKVAYDEFVNKSHDINGNTISTGLFDGSDSVVGSIGSDIAEVIRDKAIALKPALKNMALQTTASALGLTAFTECDNSSFSTLCVSVGKQFQTIAGQINVEDAYYLFNGQNHYWNPETSRYATVNANGDFNGGSSESVLIGKGAVWVPSSSTTQASEYNDDLMEIQGLSEIMNTNTFADLYQ